jgi:hypothetical protein
MSGTCSKHVIDEKGIAVGKPEWTIRLSLCLTKHHAMKAYWEWRYSSTHSLTSALDLMDDTGSNI